MVQETWIPRIGSEGTDTSAENCTVWGCSNRDAATYEMLETIRSKQEKPYQARLRTQLNDINSKSTKNFTTLVPVWDSVLSLRESKIAAVPVVKTVLMFNPVVVKGSLPGVSKQSGLFQDTLGHPKKPLQDTASYMWFAALYGMNPQGMKSLGGDQQAPLLQKLAWDTLKKEPMNGLTN